MFRGYQVVGFNFVVWYRFITLLPLTNPVCTPPPFTPFPSFRPVLLLFLCSVVHKFLSWFHDGVSCLMIEDVFQDELILSHGSRTCFSFQDLFLPFHCYRTCFAISSGSRKCFFCLMIKDMFLLSYYGSRTCFYRLIVTGRVFPVLWFQDVFLLSDGSTVFLLSHGSRMCFSCLMVPGRISPDSIYLQDTLRGI